MSGLLRKRSASLIANWYKSSNWISAAQSRGFAGQELAPAQTEKQQQVGFHAVSTCCFAIAVFAGPFNNVSIAIEYRLLTERRNSALTTMRLCLWSWREERGYTCGMWTVNDTLIFCPDIVR